MTFKIRPRGTNYGVTGVRLAELGVTFVGFDHRENCYAGIVIPPGVEAALGADPLINLEWEATPEQRKAARAWSSPTSKANMMDIGVRLRELRIGAGLGMQAASELSGGDVSPATISRIERTGNCDARHLIALADLYGASLDDIAGRSLAETGADNLRG